MPHPAAPEGAPPAAVSAPAAGLADFRARLQSGIRNLDPGYFALVMATGIVSVAVSADGVPSLSAILLALAILCYLVLVVAYGWRLARCRPEFLADAADPARAFGFFTFAAGSDVLGARLAQDGRWRWAAGGRCGAVPAHRGARAGEPAAIPGRAHRAQPGLLGVHGRHRDQRPGRARILGLPATPLMAAVHPVVTGLSVILWAFGTWLIPLLVGLGVWPHLIRRVPLRYEPPL
jgi:Voltage-dependent anion channel